MDVSSELPANHHADHPGFSGVTGVLFGLLFLAVGRANARVAADLAGVSSGDRVVDIGCGPGSAVRQAVSRGARATGVDPSAAMLRVARRFTRDAGSAEWVQGTAERVPVSDGWATIVWSLATVHHWKDVDAGLVEVRRVLAPAGRLLAIERQVAVGATGLASHGWTRQQAETFAAQCLSAGLGDIDITDRDAGRRRVWVVSATRP